MELNDVMRARQEIGRAQAAYMRALGELSLNRPQSVDTAAELAVLLGESEHVMRRELDWARQLNTRLPSTMEALGRGVIDLHKASKVVAQTRVLPTKLAGRVDGLISDKLECRDAGAIRRTAYRAVHRVDPDGAAERAEQRRTERTVTLVHRDDAMANLAAELPAEVASAAYARVDRVARSLRDRRDPRTLDQLRADVSSGLLLGTPPNNRNTGRSDIGTASPKAEIYVHVDFETLAQLADNPAHLAGHGPIPAEIARKIAHDPRSTWRRIVTDPRNGAPVDAGRTRYRPPAATADYVRVRDRECRFPGCHRPAEFTDLDHVRPHHCDGPTCAGNLIGLCRRHHVVKHSPGWTFDLDSDGTLHITTPSGVTRTSRPDLIDGPAGRPPSRKRRRGRKRRRNRGVETSQHAAGPRAHHSHRPTVTDPP